MNLVAVYNRQPAIRSSGLLRSAKPDRFLARFSHKLSSIQLRQSAPLTVMPHAGHKKRAILAWKFCEISRLGTRP